MKNSVAHSLLLIFLAGMVLLAIASPIYTWDVVPYVATTLAINIDDPVVLHQATYELLQQRLQPAQFDALIGGAYAGDLFRNAEHFAGQLNMYLVKPLYVFVLRLLYLAGLNPVHGLIMLSLVPGVLICTLLYSWLTTMVSPLQASALVVLFAVVARLPDLSRVPVPDNLSALTLLASLYYLTVRKWIPVAVALLCLAVLVRTNNIIFVSLLLTLLSLGSYVRSGHWRHRECCWFGGGLLVSLGLYFVTSISFDQQWWRLFYHTLVESQVNITAFSQAFSSSLYTGVLGDALGQLLAGGVFVFTVLPVFLLLLVIAMHGNWQGSLRRLLRMNSDMSLAQLALLSLPVFIAFFFLFPLVSGWDRFFTPFYAVILLATVNTFARDSGTTGEV